jgi:hypothetical protein
VALQTLRVEVVDLLASVGGLAVLGAGVGLATTLTVLSDGATSRGVGRGSGSVSAGRRWVGGARVVGAADRTELDVGEGDLGVGNVSLEVGGNARGGSARASLSTKLGGIGGVSRVEPEHVGVVLRIRVSISS